MLTPYHINHLCISSFFMVFKLHHPNLIIKRSFYELVLEYECDHILFRTKAFFSKIRSTRSSPSCKNC